MSSSFLACYLHSVYNSAYTPEEVLLYEVLFFLFCQVDVPGRR